MFYDRRPSVWIEPLGDWGQGAVQLVEIPTDDEIHDNIVAYWVPETPVEAGSHWSFAYRLHWLADEPYPPDNVGRVRHTRLGRGGIPGQPRPEGARKFVIDFEGGPLADLRKADEVEPVITASRGKIDNDYALQVVGTTQLARVLRPLRRRRRAGRAALLPAPRPAHADRDLALPVHPVRVLSRSRPRPGRVSSSRLPRANGRADRPAWSARSS